jgi:hypothetical protein
MRSAGRGFCQDAFHGGSLKVGISSALASTMGILASLGSRLSTPQNSMPSIPGNHSYCVIAMKGRFTAVAGRSRVRRRRRQDRRPAPDSIFSCKPLAACVPPQSRKLCTQHLRSPARDGRWPFQLTLTRATVCPRFDARKWDYVRRGTVLAGNWSKPWLSLCLTS